MMKSLQDLQKDEIKELIASYGYVGRVAYLGSRRLILKDGKEYDLKNIKALLDYLKEINFNKSIVNSCMGGLVYNWSNDVDGFKRFIEIFHSIGLDPNVYFIRRHRALTKGNPKALEQLIEICDKHGYDVRVLIENCQGLVIEPQLETIDNFDKFVNNVVGKYAKKSSISVNPKQLIERCSTLGLASLSQLNEMIKTVSNIKGIDGKKIVDVVNLMAIYSSCLVNGNANALAKVSDDLQSKGYDNAVLFCANKANLRVSSFEDFIDFYNRLEELTSESNVRTFLGIDPLLISKGSSWSLANSFETLNSRYNKQKTLDFLARNPKYLYESNFMKLERQLNALQTLDISRNDALDVVYNCNNAIKIPTNKRFERMVRILTDNCGYRVDEIAQSIENNFDDVLDDIKKYMGMVKNTFKATRIVNRVTEHKITRYTTPILTKQNSIYSAKSLTSKDEDKLIENLINAKGDKKALMEYMRKYLSENEKDENEKE